VEEDKKMSGADFRLEGTFGGSKTSREHLEGEDCISGFARVCVCESTLSLSLLLLLQLPG
jgi:hypothetical protein